MIGKTLAHYEITSLLGRGGMGVVYQAKDQKLGRDVAIKVLPEEFAKDAERVARFQREAKLLASLNRPNIATIYGLEESNGIHFLVLELIEGATLSEQLKKGSIPVEESLKLALQIAEALEAAHEKGVIHRDLKPANIKVTPDGKVKVLDFGLAKAFAGDQGEMILSDSPTLSVAATQQGIILGTAAYMSPEQARGKTVDKRADIWAFGVVLFEMLTGRPVFAGDDVSVTLARVLDRQPDFSKLPPNLHPKIVEMLDRCLEKDVKNRYHDIADARVDIQKVLADPSGVLMQPVPTGEPRSRLRTILPWAAATFIIGTIIAGVAIWNLKPKPAPDPRQVARFSYELPEVQQFGDLTERAFAVSSDGSQLVYKTEEGLYLRSMAELNARLISGTEENPQKPFFSPDGQWIGYVSRAEGKLKKISINGGAPVPLTDDDSTGFLSWSKDDMIVYASGGSIKRVSANGGNPELLVKGEEFYIAPQILPDGKTVMFTEGTTPYKIMMQSLESGERKELIAGGDTAEYLPTGHIVYGVENNLFVIPFDPDRLEVAGGPIPMVEGVLRAGGAPQYAISDSGTLIYIPGITTATSVKAGRTLVWVDRNGKEEPLAAAPNAYAFPRISPDGTKVALTIGGQPNTNIWIWDLVRKTLTRLTFDETTDFCPLWTPDGKRIVFFSARHEEMGVYWKAADGTGEIEPLTSAPNQRFFPWSWSGDGNALALAEFSSAVPLRTVALNIARALITPGASLGTPPDTKLDISLLSLEGSRERKPLLQDNYFETDPQISPDGRWMAYTSNESGQGEIYVRPFPEVNSGKWQISTSGGLGPTWSPDGRELFYRSGDAMMVVAVETETTFKAGVPQRLFQGSNYSLLGSSMWDISPDGKRFLMIKPAGVTDNESTDESTPEAPRKIIIVTNWFEELKERVPAE